MSVGHRDLISHQQLMFLVYTLHFSATELLLPSSLAGTGKSGGWMAPLVSFFLSAVPVALMLGLLVRRHPHLGLGALSHHLLGRLPARLLMLLTTLFNVGLTALCLRDMVEAIPVAILPVTPTLAVALPFLLVAGYGAYCGAEVLARLAFFFMVIAVSLFSLVVVTLLRLVRALHLLPLWDQSPLQLVAAAWPTTGWYAESWTFLPLAAMVDRPQYAGRGLIAGALIAAVHLMSCTALSIGIFGHSLVAHFAFPIHALFQQITIGEFVERLDVILITICLLGMIVKTATHLWLAVDAAQFALGLRNQRPLLLALGLAAVLWMLSIPNLPWLFAFSTTVWTPFSLCLGLGVPALLLAASWIRERQYRPPDISS
ncbi:MAG: hypothetical protein CWE10_00015 [Symbiobacterium thermophilum]|uniref:Spore germination protein n=1 Tax=Symbiobacterium thermophilum TaxID=2734 RepID=A0A953HXR8_SYMTR|nr:hypothetical protein [Symbiobacterium thermophilum]